MGQEKLEHMEAFLNSYGGPGTVDQSSWVYKSGAKGLARSTGLHHAFDVVVQGSRAGECSREV